MALESRIRVTLVVDPRFSGGTSTAVASEIRLLATFAELRVVAVTSSMFSGKDVHSAINDACDATGTPLVWDPSRISSDVVAFHNPSFLKFDTSPPFGIVCDRLFVVCHENFIRPTGGAGFDVDHCLGLIRRGTLARKRLLAPISAWNRAGVTTWAATADDRWDVSPVDWTNICDLQFQSPTQTPRDRRGRHSRPGFEKFPDVETLNILYPERAENNRILGADSLLDEDAPSYWDLVPFGEEPVDEFLRSIDFFIYFTNACWRESFGRAIAEAIAAGKLVITDPDTAMNFGNGVLGARAAEVDAIIAHHLQHPDHYADQVREAQVGLQRYSGAAFRTRFDDLMSLTAMRDPSATVRKEAIDAIL